MRHSLLLAFILALSLAGCCGAACEEQMLTRRGSSKDADLQSWPPSSVLRRLHSGRSFSLEELLRVLGKASMDPKAVASSPQKRDMHDFFVGLMGKRNMQPGSGLWRSKGRV
ncbi:tachykinin-3 [Ochotona princeps]|uniref:tachykinin-3 n=1 Tax=Ochotona princeps TaxID=9978 RepID=UPI0027147938|nr:tachykinin-3 [Ochotona princeps]